MNFSPLHSVPLTLISLYKHSWEALASGPLHWLLPLCKMLLTHCPFAHFILVSLKCHLITEALPASPKVEAAPYTSEPLSPLTSFLLLPSPCYRYLMQKCLHMRVRSCCNPSPPITARLYLFVYLE